MYKYLYVPTVYLRLLYRKLCIFMISGDLRKFAGFAKTPWGTPHGKMGIPPNLHIDGVLTVFYGICWNFEVSMGYPPW